MERKGKMQQPVVEVVADAVGQPLRQVLAEEHLAALEEASRYAE